MDKNINRAISQRVRADEGHRTLHDEESRISRDPEPPLGDERLVYNSKDTCFLLGGISYKTLLRLEERGVLTSLKLLRTKLYTREAILKCIKEAR